LSSATESPSRRGSDGRLLIVPLTVTRPERTAAATRARDAAVEVVVAVEAGDDDVDDVDGDGKEEFVDVVGGDAIASLDAKNVSSLSLGGFSDGRAVGLSCEPLEEMSERLTRKVVEGEDD